MPRKDDDNMATITDISDKTSQIAAIYWQTKGIINEDRHEKHEKYILFLGVPMHYALSI